MAPRHPLDDDRLTAVGLLMEVHEGLTSKFAPGLAAHGLSENELEILLRLGRTPNGQLRMSDLAAQTTLTTSGVTRVVDRLERSGLVERVTCDSDRRGTWASISADGMERVSAAVADHVGDIERWYTGLLSAEQLHALTEALRIVRDAVWPDAVAGAETSAATPG
ncbi:DNA-binding MarR family transcriptional regulator [Haloactinopolyspora alba]|uniref:DNA-binding MarR family transcriptional regulator n=1 Tax=Haloactinopolyspora alba TaxID=648780 RepID=A0A2P8DVT9_9ACTN|nr:MarR family transcriptional regulator [Haloactinopolyspora alba]PSL01336.1 DNA-binding MarR family transcriptional regulator [Haloactinopolyspora alba]